MKKQIEDFMALVKNLKAVAEDLAESESLWEENPDAADEIECMAMHCDACLSILKKAL